MPMHIYIFGNKETFMSKKVLIVLLISVFFLKIAIFANEKKFINASYNTNKKILIIDNKIINFNQKIDKIFKILDDKYKYSRDFPFNNVEIYLTDYSMAINYNKKTKKAISFILLWNPSKKFYPEIYFYFNEFILDNIKINKKTSFNDMKDILIKNKINFIVEDYDTCFSIKPEKHYIYVIDYLKENLNCPYDIIINLEKSIN